MKELLYFVLGGVTVGVIVPILDSFISLILALLEVPKAKASLKITKMAMEAEEVQNGKETTYAVGFPWCDDDEELIDEEEEEEE